MAALRVIPMHAAAIKDRVFAMFVTLYGQRNEAGWSEVDVLAGITWALVHIARKLNTTPEDLLQAVRALEERATQQGKL